ncbi:MAG: hypothetical protein QOF33_4003 [Thermomicrobiales bacterium]|nr:hypothetical protein [Thermomicrobiales bacterium]
MTNVEVQQGADGRSMCTGDAMFVEALYTVTVSEDGQPSTEFDDLVQCRPIVLGESLRRLATGVPIGPSGTGGQTNS